MGVVDGNHDGKLSASELDAITELDLHSKGYATMKGIEYFTKLESLKCGGDYFGTNVIQKIFLVELDVSKNTALNYLSCEQNKIPELDLSNNLLLTYLS